MGSRPSPSPSIVFGPFEYDTSSGELRKFGTRIRLQGQPLQILSILLEQPGQVISRDQLQRQLWQSNTFVDLEQGLNAAVNKMRQALGDAADQPSTSKRYRAADTGSLRLFRQPERSWLGKSRRQHP
jgi:DNA-binding winged helix-turn-helix (wHTH) protein